ncbi:hypothetical protein LINPERPRIM_LOCUS31788, partial [Linum perenne]
KCGEKKNVCDLTVQLDSICVSRLLSKVGNVYYQHSSIVEKFRILMNQDWRVKLIHIFREGNFLADYLANMGHDQRT